MEPPVLAELEGAALGWHSRLLAEVVQASEVRRQHSLLTRLLTKEAQPQLPLFRRHGLKHPAAGFKRLPLRTPYHALEAERGQLLWRAQLTPHPLVLLHLGNPRHPLADFQPQ